VEVEVYDREMTLQWGRASEATEGILDQKSQTFLYSTHRKTLCSRHECGLGMMNERDIQLLRVC
jgi:hypothetical protein